MKRKEDMNMSNGPVCTECGPLHGAMCNSGGGMHHSFGFRIALLLCILAVVFFAGVKVGELKALFSGYGMMGGRGYGGRSMMTYPAPDVFYGGGMMLKQSATTTGR